MTITTFLLICLLLIPGLWLNAYQKQGGKILGIPKKSFVYSIAWLTLGILAIWTIHNYTFPSNPDKFFPNTAYHLLEHDGFSFSDSLVLANEKEPERSLLDDKIGFLTLRGGKGAALRMSSFYEPVFVRSEGEFRLENAVYGREIKNKLVVEGPKGFYFALAIREFPEADTAEYWLSFDPKKDGQRSEFNRLLHKGYPLMDIVRATPGWERYDSQWLQGAMLLRATYRDAESPLLLFPSRLQADSLNMAASGGSLRIPLANGQRFFIGLGLDKGQVMYLDQEGGEQLRYDFPRKYRLDDAKVNDLFICSNFSDVAQNAVQGGYLFPLLRENDNRFHINAGIKYQRENARQQLQVRVIDHQAPTAEKAQWVSGGDRFELYSRDGRSQWRFKLTNLRADNPVSAWALRGFVFLFVGLVLFTLSRLNSKAIHPFEPVAYVLVFAFLVLRIILQWRMATFPPVEEVSPSEWAFLRSARHFYITVAVTVGWFGLRLLWLPKLKGKGMAWWQQLRERSLDLKESVLLALAKNKLWIWLADGLEGELWGAFVLRYVALFAGPWLLLAITRWMGIDQVERFINIAYPIAFFLFIEHLNLKFRASPKKFNHLVLNPFGLFNILFTAGYLALSDAGFGIIFLLFLLLWSAIKEVYQAVRGKKKTTKKWLLSFSYLLILGLVILFADKLIAFAFDQSVWFYWLLILPLGTASFWYFGGLVLKEREKGGLLFKWAPALVGLVLFAVASPIGINKIQDLSYVKYRAAIHSKSLDEIIAQEKFDSGEMGQILRASQNQWFINNYLRDPANEIAEGAFRLKPHFNKGSSFTTQTTDLVVTRYIISEHNAFVIFFLVALLLLATAVFAISYSLEKSALMVPFGGLLLLFAISVFIWLTATNRFVFFGQDFPMISMTSLFTLVFSLAIILMAILRVQNEKASRFSFSLPLMSPFFVLFAAILFLASTSSILKEDKFAFNLSLNQARTDFDALDEEFRAFQDTFSGKVAVDSMLTRFYYSLRDTQVSQQPFSQSVFEFFVKEQEIKTNPDELLHLVSRNGSYRFALNRSYFLIQPPQAQRSEWQGNLYAANEGSGAYLLDLGDRARRLRVPESQLTSHFEIADQIGDVNLGIIPASWTADGQPGVLIWAANAESGRPSFTITNSQAGSYQYNQDFTNPTLRLQANDFLSMTGDKGQELRFQYLEDFRYYLAKNIWLNGKQKLFYPLGDRLLWAYYYANASRSAYSGTDQLGEDVTVSIDYALTETLSHQVEDRFRKNNWKRQRLGVVALNGDGQLRALLDHRQDRIDPNDIREFNEKTREYYLRNNTRLERETFGNINLLKLPNGPGSTLKPIVYSSVTSQYKLDWPNLKLAAVPAEVKAVVRLNEDKEGEEEKKKIMWYAGKEVDVTWSGIGESDFFQIDPTQYLVRSKNLYHSMLVFLGSYSKEKLSEGLTKDILVSPKYSQPELNFPLISYQGVHKRLNPDAWPTTNPNARTFFGNKRSLIALGLYDNYGVPTFRPRDKFPAHYVDFDPSGRDIFAASRRGYVLYGYPEQPTFYQENRVSPGDLWFIRGLKQVTAGNDPMRVTPLKMAEMAGKLFAYDRDFKVTLSDSLREHKPQAFETDGSWQGGYLDFLKSHVYSSLREVVLRGTAGALGSKLQEWNSDYFYYAKTGTIKNADDAHSLEDKLLMLVISKNKLTELSETEIRENKFYVLYFTGWEMDIKPAGERWDMIFDIVRTVEASFLFQKYMHG